MTQKKSLLAAVVMAGLTSAPALAQVAVTDPVTDPVVGTTTDPTPVTDPVVGTPDPVVGTADPVPTEPAPVTDPAPVPAPSAHAGAFDALSPGGQRIASALYSAQGGAAGAMTRDDIAAARAQGGWGNVFHQMQAQGLVTAKNLGQVVSGHAAPVTMAPASATTVTVTYADGATAATTAGTVKSHGPSVTHGAAVGHAAAPIRAASAASIRPTTAAGGVSHGGGPAKAHGGGKHGG